VARKEDACVAREACVACEAFLANHSSDACVAKHVACVSDVLDCEPVKPTSKINLI
jgi:hypothetical protein